MKPAASTARQTRRPDPPPHVVQLAARDSGLSPAHSILELIGRTPLLELRRLGAGEERAAVLAKLEFHNPGGSVKDRIALGMIRDAEENGTLQPGGSIVEATAGNTGIGLALVGRALGYSVTLTMPSHYSAEKRHLCRALGARIVEVPGTTSGMRECLEAAREIGEREGAVLVNQFENPANPAAHEATTGPEIWTGCGGDLDAAVLGVGSGGTFTGVVRYLRRHSPDLPAFAVEAQGSVIGGGAPGTTRIEGIGSKFIPSTMDMSLVSEVITVRDEDAFTTARELAGHEGLLTGASGGAILFAALEIARRLGPGHRIVTVLPDAGERHMSKGLYER